MSAFQKGRHPYTVEYNSPSALAVGVDTSAIALHLYNVQYQNNVNYSTK